MNPDKVSVVIPYNPKYTSKRMLEEAKESVKKQNINTEIVVEKDDISPSHGRNKGMERAKGDYIAFLDADDRFLEKKLEKQIERMDETGKRACIEGEEMNNEEFIAKLIRNEIRPKTSSLLIDSGLEFRFDEDLERKEDDMAMIDIAMKDEMCFVDERITVLRKHGTGLSASDDPLDIIRSYKKFYRKVFERYPDLRRYEPKSVSLFIIKNYLSDLPSYLRRKL